MEDSEGYKIMVKNGIELVVVSIEDGGCNFCPWDESRQFNTTNHICRAVHGGPLIRICNKCMQTIISMWKDVL